MNESKLTVFGVMLAVNVACVAVEAEVPHVCMTERDIEVTLPLDELDEQALALLGLDGASASLLPAAVPELTDEELAQMPRVSLEESFSAGGLDSIPNALDDIGADGGASTAQRRRDR